MNGSMYAQGRRHPQRVDAYEERFSESLTVTDCQIQT